MKLTEEIEIFFWTNMAVFTIYTLLFGTVVYMLRFKLDKVSLLSMFAVWMSFFIRFVNWIVFKIRHPSDE